jgi:beta-lactamase class A
MKEDQEVMNKMADIQTRSRNLQGALEELMQTSEEDGLVADVKIAVYDIKTGLHADIRSEEKGWAASIIKLPVLVAVLGEAKKGRLYLKEKMTIDHRYVLEPTDTVSKLPKGCRLPISRLMQLMITESDNEATNMLADRIGGPQTVNHYAKKLGLERTMLGHLLCPGVPRYTSAFNPDGSNVTTPADMTKLMRHLYDPSFSILSPDVRKVADIILSNTKASFLGKGGFEKHKIKSKIGYIFDTDCGEDIHEVGIKFLIII